MLITDIIAKKRDGKELTHEEISFFVRGYTEGSIADYQASALLMAIFIRGMTKRETADLTIAMSQSGDTVDLSGIAGVKVDKHSTGGVGDKTTLIVGPMAASLGVKVAKMSGRGLGHTGGTVDKLESIPHFTTKLSPEKLIESVNKIGICLAGQTGDLAPADKKIYALRDVTATVNSIPLIASSIMSKKLAAGADRILLDVKCGSGAFVKTYDDAILLAKEMVAIGENAGRRTVAFVTDMDVPLGSAIGNTLEAIEAIKTLRGEGPSDLTELCITLCAEMLRLAREDYSVKYCLELSRKSLLDGSAFQKFIEVVKEQGGDISVILNPDTFPKARFSYEVTSSDDGYLSHIDTEEAGMASLLLGAGRTKKEDGIDYAAGIVIKKKCGDLIKKGDTLAVLYAEKECLFQEAAVRLTKGMCFSAEKPPIQRMILGKITIDNL